MSVSEAKSSIPEGEFIRWQEHFLREYDRPSLSDWQMARISYEVASLRHDLRHLFNPKPPDFKQTIKDFLVKFSREEEPAKPTEEELEKERQDRIDKSKAFWMAMVGGAGKIKRAGVDSKGNLV